MTLEDIKTAMVHHAWRHAIFSSWYLKEQRARARWWVLYRISLKQDRARNQLYKLGQLLEAKRTSHDHS